MCSQNFNTTLDLKDSTQHHIIILKNGKRLVGQIQSIKNDKVFFEKKRNQEELTLTISEIKEIKVQGAISWKHKNYLNTFRANQFIFYKNTGFSLLKGENSYRTFMGMSMLYNRGVTNAFEIGLGYSFPLLLNINMKFSTPNPEKGSTSFKSNFTFIPLDFSEEKFFLFENSIAHSFGTPDRYFNICASNYYILSDRNFFFDDDIVPKVYYSISLGGGIRMSENWQFNIENRINFNENFVTGNLLPSFGFTYIRKNYNIGFGFHAVNNLGFDIYPILDINEDNPINFTPQVISNLPFFTISRIF